MPFDGLGFETQIAPPQTHEQIMKERRERLAVALETTKIKQCYNAIRNHQGERCALGVGLWEMLHADNWDLDRTDEQIALMGLNHAQTIVLAHYNNAGHSFAKCAAFVRAM